MKLEEIIEKLRFKAADITCTEPELFDECAKLLDELKEYKTLEEEGRLIKAKNRHYSFILYGDNYGYSNFEKVEEALGIKLFAWQKNYILTGIFRRSGKTLAICLRELLAVDNDPLDFTVMPVNYRQRVERDEFRRIQEKLCKAGIPTRAVFWNKRDRDNYYKTHNEENELNCQCNVIRELGTISSSRNVREDEL